jgi:predicted nucleic acid-binding protein
VRNAEPVFVDSGAWIALALVRDPYHARARETWDRL